jgi:hypothetical protein
MFGSERLIKEYRTSSSNHSFLNSSLQKDVKLNTQDLKDIVAIKEEEKDYYDPKYIREFKDNDNMDFRDDNAIEMLYNPPNESDHAHENEEFMGTNDLIDLFTMEGVKKTTESGESIEDEKMNTITLFDK